MANCDTCDSCGLGVETSNGRLRTVTVLVGVMPVTRRPVSVCLDCIEPVREKLAHAVRDAFPAMASGLVPVTMSVADVVALRRIVDHAEREWTACDTYEIDALRKIIERAEPQPNRP